VRAFKRSGRGRYATAPWKRDPRRIAIAVGFAIPLCFLIILAFAVQGRVKRAHLGDELLAAALKKDAVAVKSHLERGADPNARIDESSLHTGYPGELLSYFGLQRIHRGAIGRTALMIAAGNHDVKVLEALLSKGADPNLVDDIGYTAAAYAGWLGGKEYDPERSAQLAAMSDLPAVLRLLTEAGADLNIAGNDQMTPLLLVANWTNRVDCIKYLIEHGADPNHRDHKGANSLWRALNAQHYDIAGFLMKSGFDVNVVVTSMNLDGQFVQSSCLEQALKSGDWNLIDQILDRGGKYDPSDSDAVGCLIVRICEEPRETDLLKRLLQRSRDHRARVGGRTALQAAKASRNKTAITILTRHGYLE
jgi:ankyrin repeat protein